MQPHRSALSDVRCSVLQRHFDHVVPLLTFVRKHFGVDVTASSSKHRAKDLSPDRWKRLYGTLVGIDASNLDHVPVFSSQRPSQTEPCTTVHDAVQEAQLQVLANASASASVGARGKHDASNNVLLKGYRRPDDRLESFRFTSTGRPGLINLYPNSMVTSLVLDQEWDYVCGRIGTDRFVWLLANTSIFVPLLSHEADGTCFVQMTGTAISERPARTGPAAAANDDGANAGGVKRKRNDVASPVDMIQHDGATGRDLEASHLPNALLMRKRLRKFDRVDSRISVRSTNSAHDLDVARSRASVSSSAERNPSEIILVRSRMFYARASRNKSGRVEVGLPSVHVLPRSSSKKELDKVLPTSSASANTQPSRSKSLPPRAVVNSKYDLRSSETRFHERRTRHLAKYIFPRQFGLHNVFTGARDYDTTTQPFRDYTVREVEIKSLRAKRTPKMLRPVIPVLAKILARHDKLNYRALLDRCCPSRVPKGRLTAQERQQIVQDLAEVESMQQPSLRQDLPVKGVQQKEGERTALAYSARNNIVKEQASSAAEKGPLKTTFELVPPAPRKPRYTNYAVPTTGQVVHFITLAIKSLLPRDVFGSLHNQKLVLATIGDFVQLRRYETFNLHQIAQSFRFTDVDWALPPSAVKRNRRLTRQEAESRKKLVLELLYWLFDGLVIPLLRTTFYITETAAYRNKVLYFRQDDWHVLSRPVLGQLKESIFEPLTRAEALSMMSSRKLGYSHVRLLPKETGVRPIVNLRRRSTKQVHTDQQGASQDENGKAKKLKSSAALAKQRKESLMLGQSINYILQSVFHVLTYEKGRMLSNGGDDDGGGGDWRDEEDVGMDMLSSSVFGPNEIYTRLKTFKQRLTQDQPGKKLYFIKVDVRCAFDSIDQGKLLEIIERILCKGGTNEAEGYRIHRFAKVMPSSATHDAKTQQPTGGPSKATKREFVRLARPDTEHIDFFSLASSLAVALHDVVFIDSVTYRYESTSLILKLLRQHITENLIKIGREFYRQRVGIPQGSSLSTLLCSFFYADMESQDPFLHSLRSDSRKNMLMRYTDDFLLVTTSKRTAKRFYQVMRKGHPEYGCFISPEKTLANFDLVDANTSATPLIPRIYTTDFPWCGLTLNTKSLSVSTDLTRYKGLDMRDTLTVEYSRKPGLALVEKMIQSVKSRCHILFTDTALNGDRKVYGNVYSCFLVAAVKFEAYLGELKRFKVVFDAKFLWRAIQRLVRFTGRYIGSRAGSAKAKFQVRGQKGGGGRKRRRTGRWKVSCTVRPHYVHWLGYSAFLTVLNRWGSGKPRGLDRETRQALVGMVETCTRQPSFSVARTRLASVAARTLKEAQESLPI